MMTAISLAFTAREPTRPFAVRAAPFSGPGPTRLFGPGAMRHRPSPDAPGRPHTCVDRYPNQDWIAR
ncbi:hypothetical protein IW245_005406 [Longispora fulva]|uniref:Uncharacterized protein n=1 Tax=Longispora fulva TaxID=619741 RepID=A0A8J7KS45_9ACTN|nr:hypothetical protein [Longispora fulva]